MPSRSVMVKSLKPSLIAGPWTRDLRIGSAMRFRGDLALALVSQNYPGWRWLVSARSGHGGVETTREAAKAAADDVLKAIGYALVNVPGGCTIETDEPKKQRVYREG